MMKNRTERHADAASIPGPPTTHYIAEDNFPLSSCIHFHNLCLLIASPASTMSLHPRAPRPSSLEYII